MDQSLEKKYRIVTPLRSLPLSSYHVETWLQTELAAQSRNWKRDLTGHESLYLPTNTWKIPVQRIDAAAIDPVRRTLAYLFEVCGNDNGEKWIYSRISVGHFRITEHGTGSLNVLYKSLCDDRRHPLAAAGFEWSWKSPRDKEKARNPDIVDKAYYTIDYPSHRCGVTELSRDLFCGVIRGASGGHVIKPVGLFRHDFKIADLARAARLDRHDFAHRT